MRTISSVLLTILMASTAHATDARPARLTLPASAPAVHDQVTVATLTTILRGAGEAARNATRQDGYSVEIEAVDGGAIARARLRYDATTVTGTWPTAAPRLAEMNARFIASADAPIVGDAGGGARCDDAAIAAIARRQAHLARGFPLTTTLAGKTFVPGEAVAVGGGDLGVLWHGTDGTIRAASITYQRLDAGIATFAVTATLDLALQEATTLELTGKLTVDAATGRPVSLSLTGAVDEVAGGTLRVAQVQSFVFHT